MAATTAAGVNKRQLAIGWVAVTISVLIASLLGILGAGEAFTEGWPALLSHLVPMLFIILIAVLAVRWPRVGSGVLVLAGLYGFFHFGVFLSMTRLVVHGPVVMLPIVAGLLYFFGKPIPRKVAYAVLVGIPVVVTAITGLLTALLGPF